MFFLVPPMIVGMQTGLLIVVGMQAMVFPPILSGVGRMGSRVERERYGRDSRGKSPTVGSRPTAGLGLADPFAPPKVKGPQRDTPYAA